MKFIFYFSPILLFIALYFGAGLWFSYHGFANAFYQISPAVAMFPALVLAWMLHRGTAQQKMDAFIDGVRHPDIIAMCMIFIFAGAFSSITSGMGSVHATVHCALAWIPVKLLLIGMFLVAAFISTAIGTSMGTIAALAPIVTGLAHEGGFDLIVGLATLVGGAMFGDNLSFISDTTIAAVASQNANVRSKLKLNGFLAICSATLTIAYLWYTQPSGGLILAQPYNPVLMLPYLLLITSALIGCNVMVVLFVGIISAIMIGIGTGNYDLLTLNKNMQQGFASMDDIMILSLMVGGVYGLAHEGFEGLAHRFMMIVDWCGSKKIAQLLIALLVALFDALVALNTVAIILSGSIAKKIAQKYHIPAHYTATWLDIFSCVVQGIIPYGAQILLVSSIGGVAPLLLVGHVYYCYALAVVSISFILISPKTDW